MKDLKNITNIYKLLKANFKFQDFGFFNNNIKKLYFFLFNYEKLANYIT